jgi:hypothetical protein
MRCQKCGSVMRRKPKYAHEKLIEILYVCKCANIVVIRSANDAKNTSK